MSAAPDTTLGYAEWQAGSPADAEVTFSRALHWDADAPRAPAGRGQVRADARSARALALAGLGRTAEARDELARALAFDPDRKRTLAQADRIAALASGRQATSLRS